ncbi:hypothetical protein VSWAT3_15479 [Vibrionales bacterium SWAT-3]|nr:hypothetical protein VSWAT3_15479 [Vibrionales bacterium SWAT-3]
MLHINWFDMDLILDEGLTICLIHEKTWLDGHRIEQYGRAFMFELVSYVS